MKVKTKIKKPLLLAKDRAHRLKFAKDHVNWTPEQWKLALWCDETKISSLCSNGRIWSWYDTKIDITSNNIQNTLKYGGRLLMIWDCFQREKLEILRQIKDMMKADS